MQITVAGAGGLIGTALGRSLEADGHTVRRLARSKPTRPGEYAWDPGAGAIDGAAIEGADAVVNLAGANIAGARWTDARMRLLRQSRVDATRVLVRAIAGARVRPRVLVSASGVGYYGTQVNDPVDEGAPAGGGFLAELCRDWEAAADEAAGAGVRVVKLRLGVVLAREGGALAKMLPAFRLGLGGRIGDGRMWMSWISLGDAVRVFRHAIRDERVAGGVNAVAPHAVTSAEFARALGRTLGRPAVVPAPAWALRLVLGRMANETLLASARARPDVLVGAGFHFEHETIDRALADALGRHG